MEYIFATKLSKEECINRIERSAKELSHWARLTWLLNHGTEFFYEIKGDIVRIEKALISQNIDKPVFKGSLQRISHGTQFKGKFNSGISTIIFLILWFGALFFIGGTFIMSGIQNGDYFLAIFPLFMLFIGIYNFLLIRNQQKDITKRTIEFIVRTLDAKVEKNFTV